MKLAELATKPKLIPVKIDDEDTVKEYGEPIEFYIYDRQPMEVFLKLAQLEGDTTNIKEITEVVSQMVMDETGKTVLTESECLPTTVMLKVIEKTVNHLGNSVTRTLKK